MFNLIFTCLACAGLAFGANNIDKVQYQSNDNVVFHQQLKRNAIYNDELYTITLTADELNNYLFENLNDTLFDLYYGGANSMTDIFISNGASYNNVVYTSDTAYDECVFAFGNDSQSYNVIYYYGSGTFSNPLINNYKFILGLEEEVDGDYVITSKHAFEYDLTLHLQSTYYDNFKSAIQADILANQPANDNYAGALGDFVSIMVAGLQSFGAGVANGVADFASALFLATDSGGNVTGLSIFGGIIAIFAGLALAVGITTRVYLWVTSLGK